MRMGRMLIGALLCGLTSNLSQASGADTCSATCAAEFSTCVRYLGSYSTCRGGVDAQTGPLAGVCAAGCVNTAAMEAAEAFAQRFV